MKKLICLIIFTIVIGSILAGWQSLPLAAAVRSDLPALPKPPVLPRNENLTDNDLHPTNPSGPSCARPGAKEVAICVQLEQQLLASTVRLVWRQLKLSDDGHKYTFVDGTVALATIKEGRYLVTHNHSDILLSGPKNGELILGFVFTTDGELIWLGAPLEVATITIEGPETLVLDFGSDGGQGFFEARGLASAEFKAWPSLSLQPGLEVAQINWDGTTVQVNWATIDKDITEHGTPRLELANVVGSGASGGGIFWTGYHIANTWSQVTVRDKNSGDVLLEYSVAALNSAQVTAQLQ